MGEYKTKYSIGDKVFAVTNGWATRQVFCTACKQTGLIKLDNEEFTCPACNGQCLRALQIGRKYYVRFDNATVGQVKFVHTNPIYLHDPTEEFEIGYMLDVTGVCSGQIYKEKELFPSREEAEKYCFAKNAGINFEDDKL